jgi:nucleoside-diphosphate-sugar epimerase
MNGNMNGNMRILVTGAGGFIGHHLVKRLRADGHWVRGVDLKYPEYESSDAQRIRAARPAQVRQLPAGHARPNRRGL